MQQLSQFTAAGTWFIRLLFGSLSCYPATWLLFGHVLFLLSITSNTAGALLWHISTSLWHIIRKNRNDLRPVESVRFSRVHNLGLTGETHQLAGIWVASTSRCHRGSPTHVQA